MTLHWSWGLSTALILALVIHLNGKGKRVGWLLGVLVQVINMGFGLAYGQWTFAFLAIPATMFLINWFMHPRRTVKPKPIDWDQVGHDVQAVLADEKDKVVAEARRRGRVMTDVFGRSGNATRTGRHRLNPEKRPPEPTAKIGPQIILRAVARDSAHMTGDQRAIAARLDGVWNDS